MRHIMKQTIEQHALTEKSLYFDQLVGDWWNDKNFAQSIEENLTSDLLVSRLQGISNEELFPLEIVNGTRGYIEKIAVQVNGCYKNQWFDACAVMLRRLLETLIIECFENHNISNNIKLYFPLSWVFEAGLANFSSNHFVLCHSAHYM